MHVLLALWLLQAPPPVVGVATPDPPATTTAGVHEWTLGGVLRVKRHDFLRWHPVADVRGRWHLVSQPVFVVEAAPVRWDRLVVSLASAPALASGMPGVVNARLQLRVPGSTLRVGLVQGFLGGATTAPLGELGSFRGVRGAARGTLSLSF